MTKVFLVRHGKAAAGWSEDRDPGLDPDGIRQAQQAAAKLEEHGPMDILVSPLKRTLETVRPFEEAWSGSAVVEPLVAEVPSPIEDLEARGKWLQGFMGGTWQGQSAELQAWRAGLLKIVNSVESDTLIVSHFVAINVIVGAISNSDRVISFRPDYCSCTVLEVNDGTASIISLGREQITIVR